MSTIYLITQEIFTEPKVKTKMYCFRALNLYPDKLIQAINTEKAQILDYYKYFNSKQEALTYINSL